MVENINREDAFFSLDSRRPLPEKVAKNDYEKKKRKSELVRKERRGAEKSGGDQGEGKGVGRKGGRNVGNHRHIYLYKYVIYLSTSIYLYIYIYIYKCNFSS